MRNPTIIRIVGTPLGIPSPADGQYIQSFEPDSNEGQGELVTTLRRKDAKRFENAVEAMEFWKQQSKVVPLRDDGKPNRPLTAFTVEIEPLWG